MWWVRSTTPNYLGNWGYYLILLSTEPESKAFQNGLGTLFLKTFDLLYVSSSRLGLYYDLFS